MSAQRAVDGRAHAARSEGTSRWQEGCGRMTRMESMGKRVDPAKEAMETLRSASFPVWAVPPSEWDGDVMVRGVWGEPKHPLSITLSYDDDISVERPRRQIQIVSTGGEGMTRRHPAHAFLLFEGSYDSEIVNFVNNIYPARLPQDDNGTPSSGPRRPLPPLPFSNGSFLEGVAFENHPEFLLYRVQIPIVELLFMAWNFEEEFVVDLARKAQPVRQDAALLQEIEQAGSAAWKKINERHRQQG